MRGVGVPITQKSKPATNEGVYGWYPGIDLYATTNKNAYRDPALARPMSRICSGRSDHLGSVSAHKTLRPMVSRMNLLSRECPAPEYTVSARQRPMSSQVVRSSSRGQLPARCKSATSRSVHSAPSDDQLRPYLELARTGSVLSGRCCPSTTSSSTGTLSLRSVNHRPSNSPVRGWCSQAEVGGPSAGGSSGQGSEFISVPCAPADSSNSRRASADSDSQLEDCIVDDCAVEVSPGICEKQPEDLPTGCAPSSESAVDSLGETSFDKEEREEAELKEQRELQASQPILDYEEQLKKYSWRMEVHGDPLNMKEPCLPKRLSYTRKCFTKPMQAKPPTHFTMDNSTFFLNTIPVRKRTYAIHSSWASEGIHQQRIEKQKLDLARASAENAGKRKFPYRSADYSFIY